ncbi:MAG: hypothetical protein AB7I50_03825 [Vicinamibacterales bacterium]
MPKRSLDKVEPGQKLLRPATTRTGVVMVQAGEVLTEALIERLRSVGVDTAVIEGPPELDKTLEEATAEIEQRFVGHEEDPWMMALQDIALRQLRALYDSAAHG